MSKYDEGMKILEEKFGNNKDNVISLATIDLEVEEGGKSAPCVRDIDAYYVGDSFYSVTYASTNKMKQIAVNPQVAVSVHFEDFFATGTATNLGWVMKPENAEIRAKLRTVFQEWYDFANNEQDENCCILEVKMKKGTLRIDHGVAFYHFDFVEKTAT